MSYYVWLQWYQDVFISRVMLRKDRYKPYWKEKFIDGQQRTQQHYHWLEKNGSNTTKGEGTQR